MASARPRLVRRVPLISRIQSYLNPSDFLLSISEELNSNEWDESLHQWAVPIGVALNFLFMIARSYANGAKSDHADTVFGDYHARRGSGWFSWFCYFIVHALTLLSTINAIYTFMRRRHYRLFEASVDVQPSTPSARRVNVNSSPMSSSPLGYLTRVLASTTAESRAHPNAARDVWEVAVWDPTPLCLRLFTFFSPGHVLVYWLALPLEPLDPRPSVTVATMILLAVGLSVQLSLLHNFFSQQARDLALIHKEVQNEYDTKFVNPALNRPVRDVGTQILSEQMPNFTREVNTYSLTTFVNRGFRTNPNTNYAPLYDPENSLTTPIQRIPRSVATPAPYSPDFFADQNLTAKPKTLGNAIRPPSFRQSSNATSSNATPSTEGGSLGIYSHGHSPLKRTPAASSSSFRDRNSMLRQGSPLKRSSTPGGGNESSASLFGNDRFAHGR